MSDTKKSSDEEAKQKSYEKEMAPLRAQQKRDQEREKIIQDAIKKGVKFDEQGRVKMKKGGSVRGHGIESKGKTKGKMR